MTSQMSTHYKRYSTDTYYLLVVKTAFAQSINIISTLKHRYGL